MKALEALHKILDFGQPVLTTQDVGMILNINNPHASQLLSRLARDKSILSLKRGLWLIDKKINPFQLVQYLTAPFPSYLSLHTALYFHGMISQIPQIIYVATIARTQRLKTPLGHYSLHHIQPDFFFGYCEMEDSETLMATPEKALIDYLYLAPTKTKLFHALPEIEISGKINVKKAFKMIEQIPSKRTRSLVDKKFRALLG